MLLQLLSIQCHCDRVGSKDKCMKARLLFTLSLINKMQPWRQNKVEPLSVHVEAGVGFARLFCLVCIIIIIIILYIYIFFKKMCNVAQVCLE